LDEAREVLLPRLESGLLGPCGTLEIHAKPKDRNEQAGYTGNHVLRDLCALLRAQFADPLIVSLDLGHDSGAVRVLILHLNDLNGRGRSSGAP
jgi:hypothetical protein